MQPSPQLLSLPVGVGREAVVTDTWQLHKCTQNMAAREQELKRFWFGPKSLVIALHGEKQVPWKLTLFTMLRVSRCPPKAKGHQRSRNSSMNYVQNLQGSLHNSLHSITKCTLLFTCLRSENGDSLFVLRISVTAD